MQHNVNVGVSLYIISITCHREKKNPVDNMNAKRVHLKTHWKDMTRTFDENMYRDWKKKMFAPDPSSIKRYHEKSSHWVDWLTLFEYTLSAPERHEFDGTAVKIENAVLALLTI